MGSERIWERGAALTSRLQSFEAELLTQGKNLAALASINRELIAKAETIRSPRRVMLDMDSTEIPVTSRWSGTKAFCIRPRVARRVVAKGEFHAGELFPRVGFIVTNLETPSRVRHSPSDSC